MNNDFKNKKVLNFEHSEKSRFFGTKVLILGLGLNQGGIGSARFFAKQGAEVRVTDLRDKNILKPSLDQLKEFKNIEYTLGKHREDDIDWADLIIRNPALKPHNKYLNYAKKKGKKVELDMGIFLEYMKPQQLIVITGTKGKSTTASLIYNVLNSLGVSLTHTRGEQRVLLAGNIGSSVLDIIPKITQDSLVVLEISSFQLEAFDEHQISPHFAVITNIYPDHLNYYSKMEEYVASKKLIAKYQTGDDFLFVRKGDEVVDNQNFLSGLRSQVIHFSLKDLPQKFSPILKGEYNLLNIAAALAVLNQLGINKQKILNIMRKFKGVEFRMQLIKEWDGIKIYNDTTATMPTATIQALKALGTEEPRKPNIILICGGMNKGLRYKELADAISWYSKAVYFIEGDVVDEIICDMPDQTVIEGRFNDLKKLLLALKENILKNPYFKKEDIILFSPGATSFNLFQNEFDRGRKFNAIVKEIFK